MKKVFLGAVVAIAIVGAAASSSNATTDNTATIRATYQDTVPKKDTTKKDTPPSIRPLMLLNK